MYTRRTEDTHRTEREYTQAPSKTRKVENDIKIHPKEKKYSFYKAKANRIFSRRFWILYLCPPNFYFLSFKHHEKAIRTIRGMRSCRM